MSFNFQPLKQSILWQGRYSRIPGREPAFHVSTEGEITLRQRSEDELLTYPIVTCAGATALAESVNEVKRSLTGHSGGSFLINEFGQVICPIQDSSDRYLVGTMAGIPLFKDVRHPGQTFSLNTPESAQPGIPWVHPYVGMPFTLRLNGLVGFRQGDAEAAQWLYPERQDNTLIAKLHRIRGGGVAVRFIVNLHGVVLTKLQHGDVWEPVFVGMINAGCWFAKET